VKSRIIMSATAMGTLLLVGAAWARNPHCAGGIQYVVQGMTDKSKGNIDDYKRQMLKATQQLESCSTEDPNDFEAIGYLGWAYAELDSMGPAGKAFATAIKGLGGKGDKKKADLVSTNRESFWVTEFNNSIAKISSGQTLYNPYTKKPENDAETKAKAEAKKAYDDALADLNKALLLKPGDARTLRSLGSVYAITGDYATAEKLFREGLVSAPGDSALTASLHSVVANRASQLIEEKKFDEAIATYTGLIKTEPSNPELYTGLGDAQFARANEVKDDARKAAFKSAGDAYAKGGTLRTDSADLPFNAALSYQNAGEAALAEAQWRESLKRRPKDGEAMSGLATTLADQKKFPEAVQVAERALAMDPKDKNRHRLVSGMYTKAGDNAKSRQAVMAYLALQNGKASANTTDIAGAAGAKVSGSMGKPEDVYLWESDGQKFESWFYWSKGQAYHFSNGQQIEKSDWSAALAAK